MSLDRSFTYSRSQASKKSAIVYESFQEMRQNKTCGILSNSREVEMALGIPKVCRKIIKNDNFCVFLQLPMEMRRWGRWHCERSPARRGIEKILSCDHDTTDFQNPP
jgi:hypothetical protein